jgi:hypothetical protein
MSPARENAPRYHTLGYTPVMAAVVGVSDIWKIFEWVHGRVSGSEADRRKRAEVCLDVVYADLKELSDISLAISATHYVTFGQAKRAVKIVEGDEKMRTSQIATCTRLTEFYRGASRVLPPDNPFREVFFDGLASLTASRNKARGMLDRILGALDVSRDGVEKRKAASLLSRRRKPGRCQEARWANCAFGMMRACVALLVLLSLVHSSRAFAANPDLETVLTGSRQRIEKLDYRVTGRLTRVEGNGTRTNYKFAAKAHWFPDGLRLLCEISGPASVKTSLLLHMSGSGHVTIEALLPGEKAVSVVPFDHWNDPLVGTDFSYEDMVESQFFWKNQELLAPAKCGARDCFVLKSISGSQDRTYYNSVTSWIDRGILYPVRVVKMLRGTGQQKEFIYYGLRQVSGVWSATQVEAKLQGKPGSSILVIERGSAKAKLGRKDFDIGQSGAQREKVQ